MCQLLDQDDWLRGSHHRGRFYSKSRSAWFTCSQACIWASSAWQVPFLWRQHRAITRLHNGPSRAHQQVAYGTSIHISLSYHMVTLISKIWMDINTTPWKRTCTQQRTGGAHTTVIKSISIGDILTLQSISFSA